MQNRAEPKPRVQAQAPAENGNQEPDKEAEDKKELEKEKDRKEKVRDTKEKEEMTKAERAQAERAKADRLWAEYLAADSSPITDLFGGQLQSSIVCQKCNGRFTMCAAPLSPSFPPPSLCSQRAAKQSLSRVEETECV